MAEGVYLQDPTLDGEVHFLEKPDKYVARILCYPQVDCSAFEERLRILVEDGFLYFIETGVHVLGMRVLGKGYTGITVVARHKVYGVGALKVLRLDSRRKSLEGEALMLKALEGTGIAPHLYAYRDFYLFRELVPADKCTPVVKVLNSLLLEGNLEKLRIVLRNCIESMYRLDRLGVDHTEVGRPGGHVFWCEGGVKIIDWDSARVSRKPSNLTSIVSFLLFRYEKARELAKALGFNPSAVLKALKEYKNSYSSEALGEILTLLQLA